MDVVLPTFSVWETWLITEKISPRWYYIQYVSSMDHFVKIIDADAFEHEIQLGCIQIEKVLKIKNSTSYAWCG